MSKADSPYLSIRDGAKYMHCRESTVREFLAQGYLSKCQVPAALIGGTSSQIRVDVREMDKLMHSGSNERRPGAGASGRRSHPEPWMDGQGGSKKDSSRNGGDAK